MSSIAEELGLIENNITTIDIACDSNVNLAKRVKRAILNETLLPIVNRKPYIDEKEKIKGVRQFFSGCLFSLNKVKFKNSFRKRLLNKLKFITFIKSKRY